MQYDRLTRLFHMLIAFGITTQMLLTLVMVHPKPGRDANIFYNAHEYLGAFLLGILILNWAWTFIRKGPVSPGHLFPWFSKARLLALKADIAKYISHLFRFKLPTTEEPSPLAGSIQGLGMSAGTLLALSGTLLLLYADPSQKMTGWLHDVKEIHEALGPLMWGYLAVHAGAGMFHQLAGHNIIQSMFRLRAQ
ncbi:cytochrome b/b6 domain-containing protein [Terasakiella pusilla]|uniref:cytochrome b/b6 domain-containing protein n=1 Tax=Terasakiella pusilla TaxID=64973 RepID=UPI003AA86A86